MPEIEVHHLGILCNVDETIMKLKLDHGFSIEDIALEEGLDLLLNFEDVSRKELLNYLFMENRCINWPERKMYIIKNTFIANIELDAEGLITVRGPEVAEFHNELMYKYLRNTVRLMRLHKEGDIRIPIQYLYFYQGDKIRRFQKGGTISHISSDIYHIEDSDLEKLEKMITETSLPFKLTFLQLAFDNFEESYNVLRRELSFLSLMISLEILYNLGDRELRYRISRNAAVFLGKTKDESIEIFIRIRALYDLRSRIVHSGKTGGLEQAQVFELRD